MLSTLIKSSVVFEIWQRCMNFIYSTIYTNSVRFCPTFQHSMQSSGNGCTATKKQSLLMGKTEGKKANGRLCAL